MEIFEVNDDLFNHVNGVGKEKRVVHCIAADFGMRAGIAIPMAKRFYLRNIGYSHPNPKIGSCIEHNGVYNLITKKYSSGKPTYQSLQNALDDMATQISQNKDIEELIMPKIGCGLDRLNWNEVKNMIIKIFQNTNLIITVYHL